MSAKTLRVIGITFALAGVLAAAFVPPLFMSAQARQSSSVPHHAAIRVAWSCLASGTLLGLGGGLFIASLLKVPRKSRQKRMAKVIASILVMALVAAIGLVTYRIGRGRASRELLSRSLCLDVQALAYIRHIDPGKNADGSAIVSAECSVIDDLARLGSVAEYDDLDEPIQLAARMAKYLLGDIQPENYPKFFSSQCNAARKFLRGTPRLEDMTKERVGLFRQAVGPDSPAEDKRQQCMRNIEEMEGAFCRIAVRRSNFEGDNNVVTLAQVWKELHQGKQSTKPVPLRCPAGGTYSLQFTNSKGQSYVLLKDAQWEYPRCSVHGPYDISAAHGALPATAHIEIETNISCEVTFEEMKSLGLLGTMDPMYVAELEARDLFAKTPGLEQMRIDPSRRQVQKIMRDGRELVQVSYLGERNEAVCVVRVWADTKEVERSYAFE